MHTLSLVAAGLVLLAMFVLVRRALPGQAAAFSLPVYLALWAVACAINLVIGVAWAGYSVAAELVVFVIVFGLPALAGWLARRRGLIA